MGGAVNTALKYVSGEYLTLLDADDRYLQGSIRKKVRFLQDNQDYAMVRSDGWVCSGKNRWHFIQRQEETSENYFALITLHKTNNWAGSYMVRTSILFDHYRDREIYPSRYGQNFQIVLPVAYQNKCGFINEPLMEYIRRSTSLTKTIDIEKQYEKETMNREGYSDIYNHVINQMISNETERNKYTSIYEVETMRESLDQAIRYNNLKDIRNCIDWLKSRKQYKLDDKIKYYSSRGSIWVYFLRLIRKVRSLICREKI